MNKKFMSMNISVSRSIVDNNIISSAVCSFAGQLNPTVEEAQEIHIAVNEAIDNCTSFAYPTDDYGMISISCKILKDNVLSIVVKDYGVGIKDVEKVKKPLFTTGGDKHSGMRFSVMEASMTECKVSSVPGKGTTVSMKKRIGM